MTKIYQIHEHADGPVVYVTDTDGQIWERADDAVALDLIRVLVGWESSIPGWTSPEEIKINWAHEPFTPDVMGGMITTAHGAQVPDYTAEREHQQHNQFNDTYGDVYGVDPDHNEGDRGRDV